MNGENMPSILIENKSDLLPIEKVNDVDNLKEFYQK